MPSQPTDLVIRPAEEADVPLILCFIRELADFEKLADRVSATEERLRRTLFGPRPAGEVLLAELWGEPVGFALFFQSYSTFLAQPGIYLEDLYVRPDARGHGVGRALLARVAKIAKDRDCGRMEWSVLDWNERAIRFYRRPGRRGLAERGGQDHPGTPGRYLFLRHPAGAIRETPAAPAHVSAPNGPGNQPGRGGLRVRQPLLPHPAVRPGLRRASWPSAS